MKKKIKDLTLQDIRKYCNDRKDCQGCPFEESNDTCFSYLIDRQSEKFFNQETEVNYDEEKEIYTKLLKLYRDKQIIVAIEELSELQKEFCKALRFKVNLQNIVEEIADVEIMLEQMKIYFEIKEDEIEEMKKHKIERTKERLEL